MKRQSECEACENYWDPVHGSRIGQLPRAIMMSSLKEMGGKRGRRERRGGGNKRGRSCFHVCFYKRGVSLTTQKVSFTFSKGRGKKEGKDLRTDRGYVCVCLSLSPCACVCLSPCVCLCVCTVLGMFKGVLEQREGQMKRKMG